MDIIPQINENKCIGAQKLKATSIRNVHKGDRILLVTKRNNLLEFIAYTQVEETFSDNDNLYDYYFSKKKLKLKGIKYFSKPVSVKDVSPDLTFVKNKSKSSNYFKSIYREVSKEDFTLIWKKSELVKTFPAYLEEVNMSFKEFMLSTIHSVYNLVKHYETRSQIEIKTFLNIVKKSLDEYGIHKSIDEIQDFYSRNAIELGFRHLPSRDPDNFVQLYLSNGEKKNFGYISLN